MRTLVRPVAVRAKPKFVAGVVRHACTVAVTSTSTNFFATTVAVGNTATGETETPGSIAVAVSIHAVVTVWMLMSPGFLAAGK